MSDTYVLNMLGNTNFQTFSFLLDFTTSFKSVNVLKPHLSCKMLLLFIYTFAEKFPF